MIRTLLTLAIASILAIIAGIPAGAHHSFAAFYFESQSMSIEGEVREFQFRSPHAILLFAARTPEGQMQTYAAEWGNPRRLGGQGIDKDTLKPGDLVVVTGSPGRTASEYKIHLKGIRRPADGWSWDNARRR
ncbi:MAG: hypothetical protein HW404_1313 [Anaerolineales bacterium]|nr:hypothetical protein [Anaerolineales bacterium]